MSDIYQILGIAAIILLMMFAAAAITDIKDEKEAYRLGIVWALVLVIIICQAIF